MAISAGQGRRLLFYVLAICCLVAAGMGATALSQPVVDDNALPSLRWGVATPNASEASLPGRTLADAWHGQPIFHYIIPEEMSLARLSLCLKVPYGQLTLLNPTSEPLKPFPEQTAVAVPLPFPIHPDMEPLRTDVLENRYVAVYRTSLSFSRVQQLLDWYSTELTDQGFRLLPANNDMSAHSLQFSNNRIALGSVEFSPGGEPHPMLIDVAIMVRPFTGAFCASPLSLTE